MNNFYSVFNDTGEGQPPRCSLKIDAKKAASSGERQLPSRCPRPEQTRRKHLDGRRENGYLWREAVMVKRFADWLEKISVAAFAVGVFQGNGWGIVVSALALGWCMWLTKRMGGGQ